MTHSEAVKAISDFTQKQCDRIGELEKQIAEKNAKIRELEKSTAVHRDLAEYNDMTWKELCDATGCICHAAALDWIRRHRAAEAAERPPSDLNMKVDSHWLLKMAEKEGNGIVSVGGLVSRIKQEEREAPEQQQSAPEPEGELVPWDAETFPPDCEWLRYSAAGGRMRVVGVHYGGLIVANIANQEYSWVAVHRCFDHWSRDGVTWQRCGVRKAVAK